MVPISKDLWRVLTVVKLRSLHSFIIVRVRLSTIFLSGLKIRNLTFIWTSTESYAHLITTWWHIVWIKIFLYYYGTGKVTTYTAWNNTALIKVLWLVTLNHFIYLPTSVTIEVEFWGQYHETSWIYKYGQFWTSQHFFQEILRWVFFSIWPSFANTARILIPQSF